jgi:hypothetical protein
VEDAHRAGIEGTIARGTRAACLRRPRDIDLMRVHLGDLLTAVEVNALRLGEWMVQMTHNVTMEAWGFLSPGQYQIHDRGGKCFSAFQQIIGRGWGDVGAFAGSVVESERLRGAMGAISQGRVFLAADCVR